MKIGHGFDKSSTHGPLINTKGVDKVKAHVQDAIDHGAKVLAGGKYQGGNFFDLTVLGDMNRDMLIHREETFGPIAALFPFETEDEVISLANDTQFGLASYFFARDISRCWRVSEKLEVGMVGVNTGIISSCYAPFGGVKESGMGREGSQYGLNDYINIKFINMAGI